MENRMLVTQGQLRRWVREVADMGSSVMLDPDIQLHLADAGINVEDIREMLPDELDRRAAKILSGLRDDVYDDSGRATLASWLEKQPVPDPWPLLQNWLDHLGPEEAEDDLRMLLMAIAANRATDYPHPAEDQYREQELEDALGSAGLNESTVMTTKQLRQFIKEGLAPGHDRAEEVWLEIKDAEDKLKGALAKLEELGREEGHYLSPLYMLKSRVLVMIGELLEKVDNANQQAERMAAFGGDVAAKISQYFGTKKMAKKFVSRVQEIGFEQAAVDFNLGADAQFEVGTAMGEYEEK